MVDGVILAFLLVSACIGFIRGFTREILSLCSWGCSGIGTFFVFPFVQTFMREKISSPLLADGVAIFALFISFLILLSVISHFISSFVKKSALGGIDRSLGLAFGVPRGFIFMAVIELMLNTFIGGREKYPPVLDDSRFAPYLYDLSDSIYAILPASFRQSLNEPKTKAVSAPKKKINVEDIAGLKTKESIEEIMGVTNKAEDLTAFLDSKK